MKLDAKDKQIIALLKEDARTSITELARKVHLARTTVQERVNRLNDKKIIKSYTVITADLEAQENYLSALVELQVDTKAFDSIILAIEAMPSVKRCAAVTGNADIFIELCVANVTVLDQVLATLGALQGVYQTRSNILMNSYFQR